MPRKRFALNKTLIYIIRLTLMWFQSINEFKPVQRVITFNIHIVILVYD